MVVVLVVISLAIILSVFGGLIFIGLMLLGSIAMLTLGVFWPIILIAIAIWLLSRPKNTKQPA